jgi:hypothetical protein
LIGNALTRGDVLGCLRGVVAFAPVLLAPGYCLAWGTNLFGFRRRLMSERLAWSVALSFGIMAIVSVELASLASLTAVCWLAAICAAGSVAIVAWEVWKQPHPVAGNRRLIGAGIGTAWVVFVVLELVDFGIGTHLYLSVTIFDHALRTAFVDSVIRTGVPPANPLYWPGHAAPMRYYYFWYVLTAAAAKLGRTTARQAMIASVAWSGFGLAAIVALYCRHFLPSTDRAGKRWPRTAVALALLSVTGLDILPAIANGILRLPTDADMEWWSPQQVASWMDSLLWVPHHVAGLVCGLFGFLLVWMSKGASRAQRIGCSVVTGLSFASAFGLSTWVAIAFALVLMAWMLWALWFEPESRPRAPILVGAGLIAMLALMPYLAGLRAAASTGNAASAGVVPDASIAGNASQLLVFGVRHTIDPDCLLAVPRFAELARSHPRVEDAIASLILLLPGYALELGFFALVLILALRARRRSRLDEAVRAALALTVFSLIVSSLLRSTVIANNDFGMRSVLIAQFFLLLLAVAWCEDAFGATPKAMRIAMLVMAGIGVAGTAYQAALLRLYLPVEDKLGRPNAAGLAEQAMALRRAFDAMAPLVPESAVVQFNTAQPSDYFRYTQMMQAGRQIATALPDCVPAFGGDPSVCPGIRQGVAHLFSASPAMSAAAARVECGRLGVSYLVATRWDAVWADTHGWAWTLPSVVDTKDVRILNCVSVSPGENPHDGPA